MAGESMSFDLYVWHEPAPITADIARAKLEQWAEGETDTFTPHQAVSAMRDALLDRFPALESLSDQDIDTVGVWSTTPEPSDSLLTLCCMWSRAEEVGVAVHALAVQHGLVCYEPGYHILDPNAAGYVPRFTLTSETLPAVPDPDDRRLEWIVRKLGKDNYFAILQRADHWYAQVGYGNQAGAPPGTYVLEYREHSADQHYRTHTRDIVEAIRFLQEFLAGTQAFKRRHSWQLLTPRRHSLPDVVSEAASLWPPNTDAPQSPYANGGRPVALRLVQPAWLLYEQRQRLPQPRPSDELE